MTLAKIDCHVATLLAMTVLFFYYGLSSFPAPAAFSASFLPQALALSNSPSSSGPLALFDVERLLAGMTSPPLSLIIPQYARPRTRRASPSIVFNRVSKDRGGFTLQSAILDRIEEGFHAIV